jgi:DNA-binding transcriptional MerR regulator
MRYTIGFMVETYTFSELAEASGTPGRRIRTYIQRGLLPAGSSGGRGARYTRDHLDRLRLIERLRSEAPPRTGLDQIRSLLDQLSPDIIRGILADDIPISLVDDGRKDARVMTMQARFADRVPDPGRRSPGAEMQVNLARAAQHSAAGPWLRLIEQSLRVRTGADRPRSVTGDPHVWHRIQPSDDLEIGVRGPLTADELELLQRIGDLLHHAFFHRR